jgi:transposase
MASARPLVTGGVDTHRDFHVAAALDLVSGVLGTSQFPTTPAGDRSLLGWLAGFGQLVAVGSRAPAPRRGPSSASVIFRG